MEEMRKIFLIHHLHMFSIETEFIPPGFRLQLFDTIRVEFPLHRNSMEEIDNLRAFIESVSQIAQALAFSDGDSLRGAAVGGGRDGARRGSEDVAAYVGYGGFVEVIAVAAVGFFDYHGEFGGESAGEAP